METTLAIASLVISLASLVVMWSIARNNWSRRDRESMESRLASVERAVSTVDERIKDAAHTRVKHAEYMEFTHETREAISQLRWDLKDGLHDRVSKSEFAEFKRETKR